MSHNIILSMVTLSAENQSFCVYSVVKVTLIVTVTIANN